MKNWLGTEHRIESPELVPVEVRTNWNLLSEFLNTGCLLGLKKIKSGVGHLEPRYRMESQSTMKDRNLRSVLVAGYPFRNYIETIAAGFKACGAESSYLEWHVPKQTILGKVGRVISRTYSRRQYETMDRNNAIALETAMSISPPDYALVMNGTSLTEKTKKLGKDLGIRLALWAYDSPAELGWIGETASGYDLLYTYEPEDLSFFSNRGRSKLLPVAHDPTTYYPQDPLEEKNVDICFVGSLRGYVAHRRMIIRNIAKEFRDARITVWTDRGRWYSPHHFASNLISMRWKNCAVKLGVFQHSEINELYNHSKICLNMHHSQSRKAANPRNFEILGAGGFLLTDRDLSYLKGLREGKEYEKYTSMNDLVDKIRYYLDNEEDRKRVEAAGHSTAERWHTYACRAHEIIDDLESLN